MNTSLRNLVLFLSSCSVALGQGSQLPKYTVATLPSASSYPTYTVQVIDGTSATDCTVGGGGYNALCMAHAGVWVPVSSAQGITSVTIPSGTPQTGPELTLQSSGGTVAVSNPSANTFNLEVASGSSATYQTRPYPNCSTTGTGLYQWAMLNGTDNGQCIRVLTSADLTGEGTPANYPGAGSLPIVGIVVAGAGTTGNATVAYSGSGIPCQYDSGSAPGAGNMAQISIAIPGDCQDLGQTPTDEHTYWSLTYFHSQVSGASGSIQNVAFDKFGENWSTYQNSGGTVTLGNIQAMGCNATGCGWPVPFPLFTNTSLGYTNTEQAIYTQVSFRWLDTIAGKYTTVGTTAAGAGASGNDWVIDTQTNADVGFNHGREIQLNGVAYHPTSVSTSVSGSVSCGQVGQCIVGNTSGDSRWTLSGNATLNTLTYDNSGSWLYYEINPNTHTWTWNSQFVNVPSTWTGTSFLHALFHYDGTHYWCVAGDGCNSASGAVTSVFGRTGTVVAQTGDYTAAQVTNAAATNASNTFTGSLDDFSAVTQIKIPVAAGYASLANGEYGFDSTSNNLHGWNGADRIYAPLASGFVSGHCGQPTSTSGKWEIADTGSACGSGGGTAFSGITSGTNTTAAMVVGSGASLAATGSGTIAATSLTALSGLPSQSADTVVMNATGGSASPTAVAMPTCTTGADLYNTSTHSWSCVSTGGTSIASVSAYNYVPLNGSTVASITTGTSITVASGNLILVACGAGSTSPPASIAVTDSLGNTFVNSGTSGAFDFRGTGPTIGISYSIATVGGSDTFTCTPNTSQQYQQMVVAVFNMPTTPTFNTAKVYSYVNTQVSSNASVYFTSTFTSTGRTLNFFCARPTVAMIPFAPQIGNWPANYLATDSNDPSTSASSPGNLACMWNSVPNAIVAKGVTQVMNLQASGNTVADAVISFNY